MFAFFLKQLKINFNKKDKWDRLTSDNKEPHRIMEEILEEIGTLVG